MAIFALRDVYFKAPIRLQNWMTSLYGLKLSQERYGKAYEQELVALRNRPTDDAAVRADQLRRLNDFLAFCEANNDYYRQLFDEAGVSLPLDSIEDLKQIPILEKETVRSTPAIYSHVKTDIIGKTGGTTGASLQVKFTAEDYQIRMAHLDYFKEQHGFKKGMKRASFTGRVICEPDQAAPVFWRYNRPMNQLLLSLFHLTEANIPHYIEELNRFKPIVLDSAPSAMIELASYIKAHNIKLDFQLIALFPTSETITAFGRSLLEEAFNAPVFDQYASSEGAPILSECSYGRMHLHHETGVIEPYGEDGEILVTSFTTHGTPLVRYRIGDRMKFGEGTCPCGQGGTYVESIEGRQTNFIVTPKGLKVYEGDLTTIVSELPNSVIQVQFRQFDLHHIEMRYIKDPNRFTSSHEQVLRRGLKELVGDGVEITLTPVNQIPRGPNGKVIVVEKLMNQISQ
ncbi:phenylacetate--CoA ligase family protein [Exiguobacterium sp. SH3S1]|uniref:phenylacetate--CoA ligase family protein n=1 Tax=Exiguobacterium sp. SH3S1 TaxID=2510955 RepID=UPI00103D4A61|nr:phenylacetate--CoA ligase family protein [Exiguobacterium sp. SH3S1]TCI64299.1 phenylacetate--CoA ligase family protein [Exiguobacterium sp. SH3S1]